MEEAAKAKAESNGNGEVATFEEKPLVEKKEKPELTKA